MSPFFLPLLIFCINNFFSFSLLFFLPFFYFLYIFSTLNLSSFASNNWKNKTYTHCMFSMQQLFVITFYDEEDDIEFPHLHILCPFFGNQKLIEQNPYKNVYNGIHKCHKTYNNNFMWWKRWHWLYVSIWSWTWITWSIQLCWNRCSLGYYNFKVVGQPKCMVS